MQAIGFYIAYLVLTILVAMLAGAIGGLIFPQTDDYFRTGMNLGAIIAIIVSLALSLGILQKKKLTNNFILLILALVAGVLAFMGGGLLGLIIPAYLTTRKK